jgi:hypothetical protein
VIVRRVLCSFAVFGALALWGCDEPAAPPEAPAGPPAEMGAEFDPATAGAVEGRVTWDGPPPEVPSYHAPVSPGNEHAGDERRDWPNPHAPHIDPTTKAVAGVVVFLRGVDPKKARPWDHPPVRVELRDYQVHVCQGDRDAPCGFVRRGEEVTLVSRQAIFHSLQVRGAAFFTRAFPDPDRPCTGRFDRPGVVELASGCGYFWMRGRLFVAEHPYYALTDAEGRFALPRVPPGEYELVCWAPDWHEAARELDAETALICRLTYRPPVEVVRSLRLSPRQMVAVPLSLPAERFGR